MSASERLKALDHRAVLPADVAEMLLYRALPQIVAVVEAAEAVGHDPDWTLALDAALSALDEELS